MYSIVKLADPQFVTGAAAALYTSAENVKTLVKKATFSNTDAANAITLEVWIVPSGGSATDTNKLLPSKTLAAGELWECFELEGHTLNAGDAIYGKAGTALKINAQFSGIKIT